MPQHVQRSMLFNFYTGFGRFRRSAWSKKWYMYGSGRTSRIASDAPDSHSMTDNQEVKQTMTVKTTTSNQ